MDRVHGDRFTSSRIFIKHQPLKIQSMTEIKWMKGHAFDQILVIYHSVDGSQCSWAGGGGSLELAGGRRQAISVLGFRQGLLQRNRSGAGISLGKVLEDGARRWVFSFNLQRRHTLAPMVSSRRDWAKRVRCCTEMVGIASVRPGKWPNGTAVT
jgi:hypothetical protein